jgi:hypothetical protein
MRVPSDGRLVSGADERMTIHEFPLFTGKVNEPEKVAPACRRIVSPGCAALSAACRFPPAATKVVAPEETGYDVSTVA